MAIIHKILPSQKSSIPREGKEATKYIGSCSLWHNCPIEHTTQVEVDTFDTIVLTCTAKQMRSSLGHEATDNNQMTPKRLSHLVIGHYEKLLPLDEFRLSPSYGWPWSSSAHVQYRLSSGPLHHLLLSNIWKDAFWPYIDEVNKSSSLSCENRTTFFLKGMANDRS